MLQNNFSSPTQGLHSNDIALLKVKRQTDGSSMTFSDFVLPACLPQDHTSHKADTQCTISGWGQVDGKNLRSEAGAQGY